MRPDALFLAHAAPLGLAGRSPREGRTSPNVRTDAGCGPLHGLPGPQRVTGCPGLSLLQRRCMAKKRRMGDSIYKIKILIHLVTLEEHYNFVKLI